MVPLLLLVKLAVFPGWPGLPATQSNLCLLPLVLAAGVMLRLLTAGKVGAQNCLPSSLNDVSISSVSPVGWQEWLQDMLCRLGASSAERRVPSPLRCPLVICWQLCCGLLGSGVPGVLGSGVKAASAALA